MTLSSTKIDPNDGDLAMREMKSGLPPEVLDVEGLLHRCMDNIDLVQRVLEKFHQRVPEELEELERAFELGNADQLARTAHRLRGSSATVSAFGLVAAATEIEDASRGGRMADIPAGITRLHDEWKKLREVSIERGVSG